MRTAAGLLSFLFILSAPGYTQDSDLIGGLLLPGETTQIVLKEAVVNLWIHREDERYVTGVTEYVFWNPGDGLTLPVRFANPGPPGISPEQPGIFVEGKRISATGYRAISEREYVAPVAFRYGNTRMRHVFVLASECDQAGSWQSFRFDLDGAAAWGGGKTKQFELFLSLRGDEAWLPAAFERENPSVGWEGLSFANLQQQGSVVLATNTRSPVSFKAQGFAPETDLIVVAQRGEKSADRLREMMFRAEAGKLPEDVREILTEVQRSLSGNPAPHTLAGLVENLDASACRLARNFLFARRGYRFRSPDLRDLFEQLVWYPALPERAVSLEDLSSIEQLFVRLVQIREQRLKSGVPADSPAAAFSLATTRVDYRDRAARCDHHYFTRPLAGGYRIVAFFVYYRDLETLARLRDDTPVVDNGRGEAFLSDLESVMEEVVASVKEDS